MTATTKDNLMDAADALFARDGFANTSLRDITARAGVNLASVNYHFGSKTSLIEAVFARRLLPMNAERLKRLAVLEVRYGVREIPLEALIEAFIGPALDLSRDSGGVRFIQLLGRSYAEPLSGLQAKVRGMHDKVVTRFKNAFSRSLPDLATDELYWRLHFMVGVLAYCMAGTDMIRLIASSRLCGPLDTEALIRRLVSFLAAGLRAAPSKLEVESRPLGDESIASQGEEAPLHPSN